MLAHPKACDLSARGLNLLIVPHCPLNLTPKRSAIGDFLRRVWPAVRVIGMGLLLVVIAADILASGRLIARATAFWLGMASLGLMLVLGVAEEILERWKVIEKPKKESASAEAPPVVRPPPPINEPVAAPDPTPGASHAIGGDLPETLGKSGRKGRWRLEGGFEWRPHDE